MKTTCILQNVVRIVGTIQLISGIVVWTGNDEALVIGHIVLGSILTLAPFALAYQAYCAKVSLKLVLVAAVWGLGLPIWGLAQEKIFPGCQQLDCAGSAPVVQRWSDSVGRNAGRPNS